jgi:ABC-type glutathione transport system ATPase component
MGESGVGKTALIDFLVRVVYQEKLEVFNVHAGIHEEDLEVWVMKVRELAKL